MIGIDLTETKFGRLTVLGYSHNIKANRYWKCLCMCGNIVIPQQGTLKSGECKSCGCLQKELTSKLHQTHGLSYSKTYRSWDSMIQRCTNPNANNYKYYGDRGITICKRWLDSFENFYMDMGDRPEGKTLDRIDNDENYTPKNCKWSTPKEQANNRRLAVA